MSLSLDVAHGYQSAANGDLTTSAFAQLRINKRITAKPTTFVPPPLSAGEHGDSSTLNPSITVRLAMKATYNLSVPNWIAQRNDVIVGGRATLSSVELAERAKQTLKHAEVLRSQTGRIILRVGCVVDGQKCEVGTMQGAFVEGMRQVSHVSNSRSKVRMILTGFAFIRIVPLSGYQRYQTSVAMMSLKWWRDVRRFSSFPGSNKAHQYLTLRSYR